MLINGDHSLAKVRYGGASKSLILFVCVWGGGGGGPKQHTQYNASGSKLYMNLKKNNFCICKK